MQRSYILQYIRTIVFITINTSICIQSHVNYALLSTHNVLTRSNHDDQNKEDENNNHS